uniref:Uncharacterized protein n=1 Tax=Myotis myotis TaxID=51298 RepID=A0A7J7WH77_MYOMY|nr:hypothetical protein mMyoMyo1_012009 [Myotis myotis]
MHCFGFRIKPNCFIRRTFCPPLESTGLYPSSRLTMCTFPLASGSRISCSEDKPSTSPYPRDEKPPPRTTFLRCWMEPTQAFANVNLENFGHKWFAFVDPLYILCTYLKSERLPRFPDGFVYESTAACIFERTVGP